MGEKDWRRRKNCFRSGILVEKAKWPNSTRSGSILASIRSRQLMSEEPLLREVKFCLSALMTQSQKLRTDFAEVWNWPDSILSCFVKKKTNVTFGGYNVTVHITFIDYKINKSHGPCFIDNFPIAFMCFSITLKNTGLFGNFSQT